MVLSQRSIKQLLQLDSCTYWNYFSVQQTIIIVRISSNKAAIHERLTYFSKRILFLSVLCFKVLLSKQNIFCVCQCIYSQLNISR